MCSVGDESLPVPRKKHKYVITALELWQCSNHGVLINTQYQFKVYEMRQTRWSCCEN